MLLDSCYWFLADSLLSYYGIWCDIKVLWTSSRTKCSSTEETSVWSYRTSLTSWSRSTQWLPSYSSTTSSTTRKKWGRLNVRQLLLVRGCIKDLWSFIGNNGFVKKLWRSTGRHCTRGRELHFPHWYLFLKYNCMCVFNIQCQLFDVWNFLKTFHVSNFLEVFDFKILSFCH